MYVYNDWNYVNYVFGLPYEEGLNVYALCIGRLNDIIEDKNDNKIWDLYLFDLQYNGFEGSFEDYRKSQEIKQENKKMNKEDAEKEYDRISRNLDHIIQLDKKRRNKNNG